MSALTLGQALPDVEQSYDELVDGRVAGGADEHFAARLLPPPRCVVEVRHHYRADHARLACGNEIIDKMK